MTPPCHRRDWGRLVRGMAYLALAIAGPFAIAYAPPSMVETIGADAAAVWGVFILIGGLGCLVGTVSGTWVPEYVFLHLLGSALTVYAVVVFSTTTTGEPGRLAGGAILSAVAFLLLDRWFDVRAVAGTAHRQAIHGDTCHGPKG